jgi:hypothetical protein
MENTRKIIVVKTNAVTSAGSRLFWMFSRTQLDLVLKELECTPVASGEALCEATTSWQDDTLPVVCLEKYFGIFKAIGSSPTRHLILKGPSTAKDEVVVSKIAIPVFTDVQTGALTVHGKIHEPQVPCRLTVRMSLVCFSCLASGLS